MPVPPSASHLLIPFAGRGTPACREAMRSLRLPRLESLLSRLAAGRRAAAGEGDEQMGGRGRHGHGPIVRDATMPPLTPRAFTFP